jgi:hypothetical protein
MTLSQLMPKEALLLSAGERPASVFFRGGEVRIDVHDAWHERTLRRLKADIVALHPDKALSGFRRRGHMCRLVTKATAFQYAQRNLKLWIWEETQWYATFGLKPLRVTGMAHIRTPLYTNTHDGSHYILPAKPQHRHIGALRRSGSSNCSVEESEVTGGV